VIKPVRQSIEGLEQKSLPILKEVDKINIKINNIEKNMECINGKLDKIFQILLNEKN